MFFKPHGFFWRHRPNKKSYDCWFVNSCRDFFYLLNIHYCEPSLRGKLWNQDLRIPQKDFSSFTVHFLGPKRSFELSSTSADYREVVCKLGCEIPCGILKGHIWDLNLDPDLIQIPISIFIIVFGNLKKYCVSRVSNYISEMLNNPK